LCIDFAVSQNGVDLYIKGLEIILPQDNPSDFTIVFGIDSAQADSENDRIVKNANSQNIGKSKQVKDSLWKHIGYFIL
jgi:hypothetical protein